MAADADSDSDWDWDWLDGRWLRPFRAKLLRWYARHGRTLPWRETCDPYRIWLSEIMLQQTTVAAVIPYFERFLQKFPDVHALAAACEDEVLQLWEGLGYYSRARNLHRAARRIVTEFRGDFPHDTSQLQDLPGIGRYTAGAIASFAFDASAPIVEANTLRLYSRLMNLQTDPRASAGQKTLWSFAEKILPAQNAREFNQALMELGAVVCQVKQPDCEACPVSQHCRAFLAGTQVEVPARAKRPAITELREAAVAVVRQDHVFLWRREPDERWGGLWDFPRFACDDETACPKGVRSALQNLLGIETGPLNLATKFRHSVTRYRIELHCFRAELVAGTVVTSREARWIPVQELEQTPVSRPARKFARVLLESVP